MPIEIIIVTYNAKEKLIKCLRSVQKYTKEIAYKLTIIDNHSSDGTADFLERNYKNKHRVVFNRKNLGFSGAANLALRISKSRFIILLDDDVEVTPYWLSKLYQRIKRSSKFGIVGCKIISSNGRIFSADFRLNPFGILGRNEVDRGQRDYVRETEALPGPCWIMRRELIEKVGYFDERFFPCQFEDIDYCIRTRLAGFKILYDGKIKIIHHHLYRSGNQRTKSENEKRFIRKWNRFLVALPLKTNRLNDILLAEGVNLVEKEKLFQSNPFWRISEISGDYPESMYKGIALLARKRKTEAMRELRKASRTYLENKGNITVGTLNLCYLLHVYFKRYGFEKDAVREANRLMRCLEFLKATLFRNHASS